MKQHFNIGGMSCSACSAHVQKAVEALEGMTMVNVNLLTNSMDVEFDENKVSINQIIEAVNNSGYTASLPSDEVVKEKEKKIDKELIKLLVSIGILLLLMYVSMGNMMWNFPLPSFIDHHNGTLGFAVAQAVLTIPILIIYRKFFVSGYKKLFKGHPNMDTLIAIGSTASLLYSIYGTIMIGLGKVEYHMHLYYETSAMILVFVSIGKYLENLSKKKTTTAITKLMSLAPDNANVERNGEIINIPSKELIVGDIVIVKKGELIPIDGEIIDGSASIDQSTITGESVPAMKKSGDEVYSSTMILAGFIKIKASKVGDDTTISTIIKLVEEASNSKAPISKLADKISGVFVPIILGIAALTFIVNILILSFFTPSWFTGSAFETSFSFAVTVVVIACPCALGLATPVAIMVGSGKGAENGLLIKNAEILEKAHSINTVVLDKTGTITEGVIRVVDFETFTDDDVYPILYNFEKRSEHPLASAIVEFSKTKTEIDFDVEDYESIEGMGIKGKWNGDEYKLGNLKFTNKSIPLEIKNKVEDYATKGAIPLLIFKNDEIIALIVCQDSIKSNIKDVIKEFEKLNIEVIMLTGDNELTAKTVANEVGIKKVYANVLPSDKQQIITSLKGDNKVVAMIGDGVNDSPALTSADLGISLGGGSDIAIESSDIILLKNDLMSAVNAINLSKRVISTIKRGLFWAFFYNFICVGLSLGILYYITKGSFVMKPMYGAIAMSLSSVSVVLNALTINWFKPNTNYYVQGENAMFGNKKITIDVDGMMCSNCVKHVEEACLKVNNVKAAKASLENKNVEVTYKGEVNREELVKAINDAGYKAK